MFHSVSNCLLVIFDFLLLLLFLGSMLESFHSFLVLTLLQPQVLFELILDVPLPLLNDLSSLLSGLVYLLVGSILFLLQQIDAVAQEFEIFFCSLSGYFGSY